MPPVQVSNKKAAAAPAGAAVYALRGLTFGRPRLKTGEILCMKFEIFPFNTREHYFSADVLALYQGKWLFCMHKNRATW